MVEVVISSLELDISVDLKFEIHTDIQLINIYYTGKRFIYHVRQKIFSEFQFPEGGKPKCTEGGLEIELNDGKTL